MTNSMQLDSEPNPYLKDVMQQIIADTGATEGTNIFVHFEHEQWCDSIGGNNNCQCVPIFTVKCDKGEFTYKATPHPEN